MELTRRKYNHFDLFKTYLYTFYYIYFIIAIFMFISIFK